MKSGTYKLSMLIVVIGFAVLPSVASAQDCRSLVQEHINWVRANADNRVEMLLVSNHANNAENRSNFVSFARANMIFAGFAVPAGGVPIVGDTGFLTAESDQVFSDREFYGRDRNNYPRVMPFDVTRRDRIRVGIQPNGRVNIILLSWGNGTITFNGQCQNGIIMGLNPEGANQQGETYLISLSKQTVRR
jgi:hypothetical protein